MDRPGRDRSPSWSPLQDVRDEWRRLSRGETAFLALAAIAIVALAVVQPGGPLAGVAAAALIGVGAGAAIAVARRGR